MRDRGGSAASSHCRHAPRAGTRATGTRRFSRAIRRLYRSRSSGVEPGWTSGWSVRASRRYAWVTSSEVASGETPSVSCASITRLSLPGRERYPASAAAHGAARDEVTQVWRLASSTIRVNPGMVRSRSAKVPFADQLALLEVEQAVASADGAQPVRDRDGGELAPEALEHLGELELGLVVERRGRLVEHQDPGLVVERTRHAQPLALPTRELDPALPDHAVELRRQLVHHVGELRELEHLPDPVVVDVGVRQRRRRRSPAPWRRRGRSTAGRTRPSTATAGGRSGWASRRRAPRPSPPPADRAGRRPGCSCPHPTHRRARSPRPDRCRRSRGRARERRARTRTSRRATRAAGAARRGAPPRSAGGSRPPLRPWPC